MFVSNSETKFKGAIFSHPPPIHPIGPSMKSGPKSFPVIVLYKKLCFLAGLIPFGNFSKTFDLEVPSRMIRLLPGVFRTLGFVPHPIQLSAEVIYLLPQLIQLLSNHHTVSCNQFGTVFELMSSWIALTWTWIR